ncbi:MAG TPA: hypothetical protein VFV43_03750, partial [Limnobacter sp.]|nr:hypothetical protein [Limnobacter sp.]
MQGFTKASWALVLILSGFAGSAPAFAQSSNQQLPFPFSNAPSASARQGDSMGTGANAQGASGLSLPGNITLPTQQTQQTQQDPTQQGSNANQPKERKLDAEKPLTGFQQFVFETTGRLLPNFGDAALQKVVPTEQGNQPVAADYEVGP